MSNENMPPTIESNPERRRGPAHSPRMWQACCLVPLLVFIALLIFAVVAGLYDRIPIHRNTNRVGNATDEQKQQFMAFGGNFFTVALRADRLNEVAFRELDSMLRGSGSLENVHTAFKNAALANGKASREFRELTIPEGIRSKETIQQSIETMSTAFDSRRRACEVMVAWNGDPQDQETEQKYMREASDIRNNTNAALQLFVQAAVDNGLSSEDVESLIRNADPMYSRLDFRVDIWK